LEGRKLRGLLADGAVVVTVTVRLVPGVAGFGETAQVDSEGGPVQAKLTLWLNPPSPAIVKVYVADCPGATVAEVEEPGDAASVKSRPVPLRATFCGLPGALSETVTLPVKVPPAAGVKVIEMIQLAPALTLAPQVLVWAKSPLTIKPVMLSGPSPVLVRVTLCSALVVLTF